MHMMRACSKRAKRQKHNAKTNTQMLSVRFYAKGERSVWFEQRALLPFGLFRQNCLDRTKLTHFKTLPLFPPQRRPIFLTFSFALRIPAHKTQKVTAPQRPQKRRTAGFNKRYAKQDSPQQNEYPQKRHPLAQKGKNKHTFQTS